MIDSTRFYEITSKDKAKDALLKHGAWAVPLALSVVPAALIALIAVLSSTPPSVAFFFFLSAIVFGIGLFVGLIISGMLLYFRYKWLKEIRERLSVDGIKANEIEWFMGELTSAERNTLADIQKKDRLLADAFRETLAARLTATRLTNTARTEILVIQNRLNKLKFLKTENAELLRKQLDEDRAKLEEIRSESAQMRMEAETRMQLIDAAARRGTDLANSEWALKKLSARTEELPLALEALKYENELRREMDKELEEENK